MYYYKTKVFQNKEIMSIYGMKIYSITHFFKTRVGSALKIAQNLSNLLSNPKL